MSEAVEKIKNAAECFSPTELKEMIIKGEYGLQIGEREVRVFYEAHPYFDPHTKETILFMRAKYDVSLRSLFDVAQFIQHENIKKKMNLIKQKNPVLDNWTYELTEKPSYILHIGYLRCPSERAQEILKTVEEVLSKYAVKPLESTI